MAQYPPVNIDNAPGYVDHFTGWLILTPPEHWPIRTVVIGYEDERGVRRVAVVPESCITLL